MKNREIKFRAFVETYNGKEMVNNWCFLNPIDNHFNAVDLTNERPDIGEVYAIMQFTGLHDKQGKEIYEGDITDEGLVIFHEEYLGFFVKNTDDELTPLHDIAFYEVIGNIFENPQLLEA